MAGGFKTFPGKVPGPQGVLKAHSKDPRLIRPTSGSHNQSADVAQLAYAKRDLEENKISQYDSRLEYQARQQTLGLQNLPAQLTFSPFAVNLGALVSNPFLLVPRNTSRYALIVSYRTLGASFGAPGYSFGPPISLGAGNPPANSTGIFFTANTLGAHFYNGQTCPVDDIWIFTNALNSGQLIVYEGTIATDANQI